MNTVTTMRELIPRVQDTANRRHFLSMADLTASDLLLLVERGAQYYAGRIAADGRLSGCVVGIYFRATSTRTRTAFSTAALRLGAHLVSYGPLDLQENTGERAEDTGKVLSGMLDAFVARTVGSTAELRAFAAQDRMAVINAMSEGEHPTQAVSDLAMLAYALGRLDGIRMLYVGEGNNTATALALGFARLGRATLDLRTPAGYGLPPAVLSFAVHTSQESGSTVREAHSMADLPDDVDVVYTTRWQTTGTTKPDPGWRQVFAPYRVSQALMQRYPDALFMHDLPAHRGDEVDAEVLDGPRSIAFQQAEMKMYSAMAVLEWCVLSEGFRRGPG